VGLAGRGRPQCATDVLDAGEPTVLMLETSWGAEEGSLEPAPPGAPDDIFARYAPPFDVTSDMLLVAALCPTAPLRAAFPSIPFLSVLGKTPLVIWFSRITAGCSYDAAGAWRCEGGPGSALYHELTSLALLWRPALFLAGIYATSKRSIRIGRRYGMPKQPLVMGVRVEGSCFEAAAADGALRSAVRARLLGCGAGFGRALSVLWPLRLWPVRFPSGSQLRAVILATPRAHLAYVEEGTLSVEARWLAAPLRLLPFALYLPGLRMRLPRP
jgi:hypothetical protein